MPKTPNNWIKLKTQKVEFQMKDPTFIGRIAGWSFYEDPIEGDEVPLRATKPNDPNVYDTRDYDMPDALDLAFT